jgi:hypothetical protein
MGGKEPTGSKKFHPLNEAVPELSRHGGKNPDLWKDGRMRKLPNMAWKVPRNLERKIPDRKFLVEKFPQLSRLPLDATNR